MYGVLWMCVCMCTVQQAYIPPPVCVCALYSGELGVSEEFVDQQQAPVQTPRSQPVDARSSLNMCENKLKLLYLITKLCNNDN